MRGQLNDPTSLNRYVYAGDDPVNFTDPSGQMPIAGIIWYDAIPMGVFIIFSAQDLQFLSGPWGGFLIGAIGGLLALLLASNPWNSYVAGLFTAFLIADSAHLAAACPGGLIIRYYFGDPLPYIFCL